MMKIRTLIVDDEPLARLNLASLLALEADFEVVAECADAPSAITAIARARPDLVFLDVQMPGMDGFDVIGATPRLSPPAWIFVTAHDRYAVQAFEAQALDYLQKPFRRERFAATLERVRRQLRATVREAEPPGPPSAAPPVMAQRMAIKSANRVVFVACDEIDFIRAAANYVTVHVGKECHDVREKISEFEARLPRGHFVRIHRSYVVPLAGLHSLFPVGGGETMAVLRGGRELPVGASYLPVIRSALVAANVLRFGGVGCA